MKLISFSMREANVIIEGILQNRQRFAAAGGRSIRWLRAKGFIRWHRNRGFIAIFSREHLHVHSILPKNHRLNAQKTLPKPTPTACLAPPCLSVCASLSRDGVVFGVSYKLCRLYHEQVTTMAIQRLRKGRRFSLARALQEMEPSITVLSRLIAAEVNLRARRLPVLPPGVGQQTHAT